MTPLTLSDFTDQIVFFYNTRISRRHKKLDDVRTHAGACDGPATASFTMLRNSEVAVGALGPLTGFIAAK